MHKEPEGAPNDRRRHTRKRMELAVRCQPAEGTPEHAWQGRALDISVGGLSLISESPPPTGQELIISLYMPSPERPAWSKDVGLPEYFIPITGLARVIWSQPLSGAGSRCGLRFLELDAEARASLFAMLRGLPDVE